MNLSGSLQFSFTLSCYDLNILSDIIWPADMRAAFLCVGKRSVKHRYHKGPPPTRKRNEKQDPPQGRVPSDDVG
ncbi:MAG: hypothetical protein JWR03_1717 [Cohnella sp.]|jgi:hypothetical protein|nr:hypothetical protein [Cohnella sp.]